MQQHTDRPTAPDAGERAREGGAEAALYARLAALGVAWRHHDHPPLHTVAEAVALRGDLPGAHIKNMFLKDKRGGLWLVSCLETRQIRIRDLERAIGTRGCSFARPEVLWAALGVRPGAVTPLAVINDRLGAVQVVLDARMMSETLINAHPLHNRATTAISPDGLRCLFADTGHRPIEVDFDELEAKAREAAGGPG